MTKSKAYLVDLQTACQAAGCRKWATVELFYKCSLGKFCRECGRRKLAKVEAEEK
jgi:hypothetical protein